MTGQQVVAEALRQMSEGEEYTPLERMIADLTPEQATRRPAGAPYSIATIVWHTWFWINVWVEAIGGSEDPYGGYDPDSYYDLVIRVNRKTSSGFSGASVHSTFRNSRHLFRCIWQRARNNDLACPVSLKCRGSIQEYATNVDVSRLKLPTNWPCNLRE